MSLAVPTSSEFPTLAREGLVYLDTAATSQTVRPALEAMDRYYETYRASIHRGIYAIATEATDAYELARERVARFTNSTVGETVFTKNATEAINLVAYSWGRANVGPDDLVVLSQMEHHANIVPWQLLGCRLAYIPMGDDGVLDLDAFDALLEQGPKLVAVAHVSNVVGTINPVAEMVSRAHAAGAVVLVDGAQAVPSTAGRRRRVRRRLLRLDRPQGLRADRHRRAARPPLDPGGDAAVPRRRAHDRPGRRLRVHLGRAADALRGGHDADRRGDRARRGRRMAAAIGMENVREHGRDVTAYALERLAEVPGLSIHGPAEADGRGSLISFALDTAHPHDVAEILGREGVCVRAGHHCAQPLMRRLGVPASTRASFAVHATRDDVDRLIDALGTVQEIFA